MNWFAKRNDEFIASSNVIIEKYLVSGLIQIDSNGWPHSRVEASHSQLEVHMYAMYLRGLYIAREFYSIFCLYTFDRGVFLFYSCAILSSCLRDWLITQCLVSLTLSSICNLHISHWIQQCSSNNSITVANHVLTDLNLYSEWRIFMCFNVAVIKQWLFASNQLKFVQFFLSINESKHNWFVILHILKCFNDDVIESDWMWRMSIYGTLFLCHNLLLAHSNVYQGHKIDMHSETTITNHIFHIDTYTSSIFASLLSLSPPRCSDPCWD